MDAGASIFAATLVLGPQLFGGRFGWGICLIAVSGALGVGLMGWAHRKSRYRLTPLAGIAALCVAWTAFQALPLPLSVVEVLAPDVAAASAETARLLGRRPTAWLPLSFSPARTLEELLKVATLLTMLLGGHLLARAGRRQWLLHAVGASAFLMVIVGVAHAGLGIHDVYGLHRPEIGTTLLPTPIANVNHLSAFFALSVPVLVGLALDRKDSAGRGAWVFGAVVVAACALISASRSGALSLILGLVLIGVVRRVSGREARARRGALLIGALVALGAITIGLYFASTSILNDLGDTNYSKIELAGQTLSMALDHPFFGVGRGAFSEAFVSRVGTEVRYTHPENTPAQWLAEWGIIVGTLALAAVVTQLWRGARTARTWAHVGAVAALVALGVHELFDFATELFGIGVVAAALLGSVLSPRSKVPAGRRWPTLPGSARLAAAVALALVGLVGWRIDSRSVESVTAELRAAFEAEDSSRFARALISGAPDHPNEPAIAVLAATEALSRGDDERALPWLNHAMLLAPGWDAPHALTARYLIARGRFAQALLEVRVAEQLRPGSAAGVGAQALELAPEEAHAQVRANGGTADGRALLDRYAARLPLESPATEILDAALVAGDLESARVRSARRSMDSPAEVLRILAPAAGSRSVPVQLLRSRAYLELGRPHRALEVLAHVEPNLRERRPVLEARARIAMALEDEEAMRRHTAELRGAASGNPTGVAASWIVEGDLERGLGNDGRAMQAYERAHRIDPSGQGLSRVAAHAERLGLLSRSVRAFSDLCQRAGGEGTACQGRDRVRRRMSEPTRPTLQPSPTRFGP